MPKRKELINLKQKSEKKRQKDVPESENEYLAAGVDFEEAGEKWRAGDAAKSLRFFIRATETYDAGLKRFPRSYDLAYNKARLQYEVAQQPRLVVLLPTPLLDLLQVALDSHRVALKISQDHPDLLFNTAQALTSLAETAIEGNNSQANNQDQALHLLQEALELFRRCLNLQECRYNQTLENAAHTSDSPMSTSEIEPSGTSDTASNPSEEQIWAAIEEPITTDTLLDSAVAQLDTLALICGFSSSQGQDGLAWIEEYYRSTLQSKVRQYAQNSESGRQHEAALSTAKFTCSLSDAAFQHGRLDLITYDRELAAAFSVEELNLANDPQGLCDRADAELAFDASVHLSLSQSQTGDLGQIGDLCWKHLTKALDSLAAASKIQGALNVTRMHVRRGDCEILRLRLGDAPLDYELAVKSAPTLLENAEIYYRTAISLSNKSREGEQELAAAEVKQAVVLALSDDSEKLTGLLKVRQSVVEATMQDIVEDGLLGQRSVSLISDILRK